MALFIWDADVKTDDGVIFGGKSGGDGFLTRREVCIAAKVCDDTLRARIEAGHFPANTHVGKWNRQLWDIHTVQAYCDKNGIRPGRVPEEM